MGDFNLLKNMDAPGVLGARDGKLGAIIKGQGESFFITTHMNLIPLPPYNEKIVRRKDYRFGDDDFIQWPQSYDVRFPHLAAVALRRGNRSPSAIMWWTLNRDEFMCPENWTTVARGLGKLSGRKVAEFERTVTAFWDILDKENAEHSAGVKKAMKSLRARVDHGLLYLSTVPATYDEVGVTVVDLQRCFLELEAMHSYVTVYQRRMENPQAVPPTEPARCVGAFLSDVKMAQLFHVAGLPYWLVRPTWVFTDEKIRAQVEPVDPRLQLEMMPAERFPTISAGEKREAKLAAFQAATTVKPWYRDFFNRSQATTLAPPATYADTSSPSTVPSSIPTASRKQQRRGQTTSGRVPRLRDTSSHRHNPQGPCPKDRGEHGSGRDKYLHLERPEMPLAIEVWRDALAAVDKTYQKLATSTPQDSRYVFPEPGLLLSSDDEGRRRRSVFIYMQIRDAILYRIAHATGSVKNLSTQQWRDILHGKLFGPNAENTKAGKRLSDIHELLQPALRACGMDEVPQLDEQTAQRLTPERMKEVVWDVAESEFRFELLALDRRASTLERPEECQKCFAGGMLMGMPLWTSKQGLAAATSKERHPFVCQLAKLMCDWRPMAPDLISHIEVNCEVTEEERNRLEQAVARYYCQCFHQHFGRAAVVPLRLEHDVPMNNTTTQ